MHGSLCAQASFNSKPQIKWDGVDDVLATSDSFNWADNAFTMISRNAPLTNHNGIFLGSYSTTFDTPKKIFQLKYKSGGNYQFLMSDGSDAITEINSSVVANSNEHTVVAVANLAKELDLYVDGVLEVENASIPTVTKTNILSSGMAAGNNPFNGYSNCDIYFSNEKTAVEITEIIAKIDA